jgi:hypothetical protein
MPTHSPSPVTSGQAGCTSRAAVSKRSQLNVHASSSLALTRHGPLRVGAPPALLEKLIDQAWSGVQPGAAPRLGRDDNSDQLEIAALDRRRHPVRCIPGHPNPSRIRNDQWNRPGISGDHALVVKIKDGAHATRPPTLPLRWMWTASSMCWESGSLIKTMLAEPQPRIAVEVPQLVGIGIGVDRLDLTLGDVERHDSNQPVLRVEAQPGSAIRLTRVSPHRRRCS